MAIRVALNHRTRYTYDRVVDLSPQTIRLRPAPHSRTKILSYSLQVEPADHFENWQQDPHGNYLARCVFPKPARELRIEVDLVAEMTVINPFDFFVESSAETFPFDYEPWLAKELRPYLEREATGPQLGAFLDSVDRTPVHIVDFLVGLNQQLQQRIKYLIRMEPGVQSCETTLSDASGSCRDSAWLMVQTLRNLGLAARFVSGYLIQLLPDQVPLDGPPGPATDFCDLHAWSEVFIPGAGWVGLDPTSGLLAAEGHIPLAGTPDPSTAAPITGSVGECESEFGFEMSLTRIHEDPRVTKPYSEIEWARIEAAGQAVDQRLRTADVRLTMGGEPTFVSIDDMEGDEWNSAAVGPTKERMAAELVKRLGRRFATGGLLHFGQGKWYPGEPLPRWSYSCYWRTDGEPIWSSTDLTAAPGSPGQDSVDSAQRFIGCLADRLEVDREWIRPVFEDVWHHLDEERKLPLNVDPSDSKLKDPEHRARLARMVEEGLGAPAGFVLPLERAWWQADARWISGPWPVRSDSLFLMPGDSPIGLRLPLDSLPWTAEPQYSGPLDPTTFFPPLPAHPGRLAQPEVPSAARSISRPPREISDTRGVSDELVRTALCVESRAGRVHLFMPPVQTLEDYLDLAARVEQTAQELQMPVVLEGYPPPSDHRVNHIKVTPDPGVIEVNVHPSATWTELVHVTTTLYEEARQTRLGTEKFDLDGRHTGTGGGNHVVLGGRTPLDSPFLRRPDLLRSLLAYWNNHPALSYLFSSTFVGPTSQAPRVDEGRRDALYELEIAFSQIPDPPPGVRPAEAACPPWHVDRVFRHLLVDVTGNTHRAEFCIDKLYSPDTSTGRLGLVELRALEMPPHPRMSLTQLLLLRALVARFWEQPYRTKLVHWGTSLHDRFLLPHFVQQDFGSVIEETREAGFDLSADWFLPHLDFRFPLIGSMNHQGIVVELRQAIEPWYVLGEEPAEGGTTRYVDSSVERLQVKVTGMTDSRHVVACNGRRVPLQPTGTEGQFVAAVRYRAWQPPSCLHPSIEVHTPLVFDLVDTWSERSIGGCTYHVAHPGGLSYETFPVNANEAESRRASRYFHLGHTSGTMKIPAQEPNDAFPLTLDLRRPVEAS